MAEPPPHDTLKASPNRTVRREIASGARGRSVVVKRYRAREWWRRPGDRRRARGEYEVLRALAARGVAVPEAVELRRRDGAWEVVCVELRGARTLDEVMRGAPPPRQDAARLADALGTLLASAHLAGLDHADLHAGNVLVDGGGRPHLVDFTHARLREPPDPAVLRRDLVALAADARERVCPGLRRRGFVRWWRGLGEREHDALGSPGTLAAETDRAARARRREAVRAHRASWFRGFDALRECSAGARGLVRREIPVEGEPSLVATVLEVPEPPALVPHPLDDGLELLVTGAVGAEREPWGELGRASEHALPCAEPTLLLEAPRARAAYALPAGSAPGGHRSSAAALADLRAALADRGFAFVSPRALWVAPDGSVRLGPGCSLVEDERSDDGR